MFPSALPYTNMTADESEVIVSDVLIDTILPRIEGKMILFTAFVFKILWHIHPLPGNDRETNNETMAIARQQLHKYETVLQPLLGSGPHTKMEVLWKRCFLCGPLRGYITRPTKFSSVSAV
jgi:hypothetical protein